MVDWTHAGVPRRPAGPGLHPGARRLDHLGRRPPRPRPGRARRARGARTGGGRGRPPGGPGRHRRPPGGAARRGAPGRPPADGGGRLGPRRPRPRRRDAGVTGPPRPGQKARPRRAKPRPDLPRRVAFDLLRAVAERDAYANLTLPALLREHGLDTRDAAFTTELAYGTLRGQGTYDVVLAACVDRPLDQVDPPVLDLLRLGAHQLLGDAGPVARRGRRHGRAGPRGGRRGPRLVRQRRAAPGRPARPRHLAGRGRARLRHRPGRATWRSSTRTPAGWSRRCATPSAGPSRRPRSCCPPTTSRRWSPWWPGPAAPPWPSWPRREPGPAAGRRTRPCCPPATPVASPRCATGGPGCRTRAASWWRSRWPPPRVEGSDARWLDLCAGPGGKAALLGAVAAGRGAALLAAEVAPHRAGLVARVVGDTAGVVVADGRAPAWRAAAFDRVLVDAPCTGLGALRRRPEARWRRRLEDVAGLTALQGELLRAGLDAVRPGGLVAYVTCSPHLAETRSVVLDVLHRQTGGRPPGGARRRTAVPARRTRSRQRSGRAALAAPARHRRDVPEPAAPRLTTGRGRPAH